jgi:hypothetical protein
MMIPFYGSNLDAEFDSFNFYHSQSRIVIERTFGVFVSRWGILWKPLSFKMKHCLNIVHACCRLHNFCVRRNLQTLDSEHHSTALAALDDQGVLVHPDWRLREATEPDEFFVRTDNAQVGNTLRDSIVDSIIRNDYRRPERF